MDPLKSDDKGHMCVCLAYFLGRKKALVFMSFSEETMTKIFFIEVYLIYDVVLVSGVQQSDSVVFLKLYSIIGYYKISNRIPCVIQ